MTVKDEKRMATTEMRIVRLSLLEHRMIEEILEEANVEPIATFIRRGEGWNDSGTTKEEIQL